MVITTSSSREFNQDIGRAKQVASKGPVVIPDRGRLAHLLLLIEEYRKLAGCHTSIVDPLAMAGVEDIDFDPPRLGAGSPWPADLS